MSIHGWHLHRGTLVICPCCRQNIPIKLGADVLVSVRVHPLWSKRDTRRQDPSAPDLIAVYHDKPCCTALELRIELGVTEVAA